jgi:hypothetical protein
MQFANFWILGCIIKKYKTVLNNIIANFLDLYSINYIVKLIV